MAEGKRRCGPCETEGRIVVAKYRCPACDVASCCLACVKKHKAVTNCSGIRNRAAPVRKLEYTDTHLMSDYTLMEDAARVIDCATRTRESTIPYINGRNVGTIVQGPGISKNRMNNLIKEAAKRNINLRFMPRGYARHTRNTSTVRAVPEHDPPLPPEQRNETRDKAMFWHLDIYFASCNEKHQGTKLVKVDACEEEELIGSIVEGAVGALKKGRKRRRSEKLTCLSKANDGYAKYLDAKLDDLAVFLRNEHILATDNATLGALHIKPVQKNSDDLNLNRYVEVDVGQSLRQVLSGRAVVEFPILYIAFKGSREADEIACAVSGIFEKPEESSGSGSSSESEQEEEEKKEDEGEGEEGAEKECSKSSKAESDVKQQQVDSQQTVSNLEHPEQKPSCRIKAEAEPLAPPAPLAPLAKLDKAEEEEEEEERGQDDKLSLPEAFPTDAASRGSGFHLDQPFTKESFKAILETRIPRKPRQDRANSDTQSSAAKLTASG